MAESVQAGSAGDKFRAAAEARVAFLTNTTELSSPEVAQEYMKVYDATTKLGGMDMRTAMLPPVNPDMLVVFDDEQLQTLHSFMGRVALETAPSGVHMPYAQRQQYATALYTLRAQERQGTRVAIGTKAGGLAVVGLMQDNGAAEHYADTLAVLGSAWDGSWASADLNAVAFNGAAVRNLRTLMGEAPQVAKMHEHKLVGPSFDLVADLGDDRSTPVEKDSLTVATSAIGVNEYEWLMGAGQTIGLSSSALMGIAADVYSGRMRLRGSPNWMRLFAFYKNLDIPPAPHEAIPTTQKLLVAG